MFLNDFDAGTKLYSGNANPFLAKRISDYLGTPLSPRELSQFSDKEIRCEILSHVRDSHVYIIQSTSSPVNDHLMEILILADAIKRQGVKEITAIVPYYGYARQDRKPGFTRTPITSKLVADMFETAGITRMVTIDIHSEQQCGFFNIPVTTLSASPELVGDVWRSLHDLSNLVVVSPDAGGVERARSAAKQLENADLAIVDKRRPSANVAQVMNIIGNVEGKDCIMFDDMIDTAGTLCKAANALKKNGAATVKAYATHGVFSGAAFENLENSVIDEVVVTDSIEITKPKPDIIRQISVANLIAETIYRLRTHKSISEIYTGA